MYTGARLKLLVAERRSIRCHRASSPLLLGCQDPATKRLRGNTLEFSPGTASKLDIRNFAGAMEDLDLLRDPACEVQAALTTFGVTQPADADALYSLGGRKKFSATVLFAFFANNVLDPAIGNKPHHGDHHVNCDRYPGTNKRQQYRRSIKCRGNFAFYVGVTPNGHRLARTRMHARARNH